MNIYEMLQNVIVVKKYRISSNEYSDTEKLDTEEDRRILKCYKILC